MQNSGANTNKGKPDVGRLAEGRGNLVRRTEELRQLGVKSQKELPEGVRSQALEES